MSARCGRDEESDTRSVAGDESDVEYQRRSDSVVSVKTRFARFSLTAYNLSNAAARSTIVETHEAYDVVKLCDYISEHHPGVPVKARPYLAIGDAAGAQHASGVHFLRVHIVRRVIQSSEKGPK